LFPFADAISSTYKTAKKRSKRQENGEEEEYKKKQRKLQRLDRVNSCSYHPTYRKYCWSKTGASKTIKPYSMFEHARHAII